MQNRSYLESTFFPIELERNFPVSHYTYTQKYRTNRDLHYHDVLEIGLCTEGSGIFFSGSQIIPFHKGDVSIIMPNHPHIAQSPNERPSNWHYMSLDAPAMSMNLPSHLNTIISEKDITTLVKMIFSELDQCQANYMDTIRMLLQVLDIKINRIDITNYSKNNSVHSKAGILLPALSHISQNYRTDISIRHLASLCNLSDSHFRRLFKEATLRSPQAYLIETRIKAAKILLQNSDDSITAIAGQTGYSTLSCFNRHFKSIVGMSPRSYRQTLI